FDASTLTLFRKRLTHEIIMEANEYILDHDDENTPPTSGTGDAESSGNNPDKPENQGTVPR
ncbi:MAG: transposase, partial [Ruminococcus sp.]|nr:transposase [Ruminococcus sp.]